MTAPTTRWSLVLATRGAGQPARDALAALCAAYRPAVLAHFRRCDDGAQAEDLTQSFFLHFLEQQLNQRVEPARGSFRAFVFVAAENHRRGQLRAAHAGKRQALLAEDGGLLERIADPDADPARQFDRDWALLVLEQARVHLRDEAARAGNPGLFQALSPFLHNTPEPAEYARIGAELGMSANTVAVAVKRLRERYRAQVRIELADTLPPGADIDAELEWLKQALRSE